jgi:hypothetical protein
MGGDRDVDGVPSLLGDAPEGGRAAVAEDRLGPDREEGGHPAAELRQLRAPDGVDAPVDHVKPTLGDAVLDRGTGEAQREQLLTRDDPVLATSELPSG